jgi:hypothetical protein
MAQFYQPGETQGTFEASSNTLTLNQGDRAFIGFRATSQKEYEDTTVDTTENVVLARYTDKGFAIWLEIDTSTPIEFQVTARQDVPMSAVGKDVVKPLNVFVRGAVAANASAVGQEIDPAGCWAACLSYYLNVTPGRSSRRFIDVVGDFNGVWDSTGFINVNALRTQLAAQRPRYHMKTERVQPARLKDLVGRWPLVVGFRHPGGFGHMNVIVGYDESSGKARAMDPWFPNPPAGTQFTRVDGQVVFASDVGSFKFTGGYITQALSYFQAAMGSGMIFVGYPEEYDTRMSR